MAGKVNSNFLYGIIENCRSMEAEKLLSKFKIKIGQRLIYKVSVFLLLRQHFYLIHLFFLSTNNNLLNILISFFYQFTHTHTYTVILHGDLLSWSFSLAREVIKDLLPFICHVISDKVVLQFPLEYNRAVNVLNEIKYVKSLEMCLSQEKHNK